MKRAALLSTTGITATTFNSLGVRGLLPFGVDDDRNFKGYTLDDAIRLALFLKAAEATDQTAASFLARRALKVVAPVHPLFPTDGAELFVGLARLEWDETPEGFEPFAVFGGRWQDLGPALAAQLAQSLDARAGSLLILSLTRLARQTFEAARDLGLTEAESLPPVPENLTGFPDWFRAAEAERRAFLLSLARGE